MRKISKKTISRIKQGYHDDLMDSIEFLIDTFESDKFDAGYLSCLQDMSVRSYRLAEYIIKNFNTGGSTLEASIDTLSEAIEEYFNEAIKQE